MNVRRHRTLFNARDPVVAVSSAAALLQLPLTADVGWRLGGQLTDLALVATHARSGVALRMELSIFGRYSLLTLAPESWRPAFTQASNKIS